ncbi:glycosyltransferase [Mesorhizobium sp. M2A.F.Ca.ET.037.01.1.1]|uniref:glycosyltransferase n=1 Tax=unclassified Mesorhizobium TaxID=325217 RepID=UPI000F76404E|nr:MULTISPECIES: glycosyltransferase [unclassified Mesorhizobium]RUY06767.1 glycosyltransferase [Mesorhizobium sp. M2A.F.Ca.ET.040.01.1.1]RVC64589.1 glycosyltransferase [Mesorhizobium sp. M2A.F.Ca.ET.046.02.1.1]RVC70389.1 glycosyltransferase [Mesorhizobium sp. M00.F.Ca.ET.038.03.1.1]AZO35462.1 glycosyltransferase [Mesorhizobium sp. M2A.F.Ca.ET.046.03.2.1]RUX19999.1 glycosyltransferase [Mesorhizobium sp. M2A.F.Ca.ET.037.01.1.1]
MPHAVRHEPVIAVLLPCYNEELTIGEVVRRFRETLPSAAIYVYDNNSKDLTALKARAAGAIVVREPRQGKGNVVRRMFADIDADIYVMADGDGTYAPEDSPQLINVLQTERSDMVVGTRRGVTDDAGRNGHAFGNHIFNRLYKGLFGTDFTDIFSGYRVFSRRFVKSFPAVSGGFEIETEMSVHASQLKLPVSEMALDYGRRPEGSSSKLSTFRDGARILWMFAMLVKETQPLRFFGTFALFFLAASIGLMIPVVIEFAETGLVPRMPTWVLSIGMLLLAMLSMMTGLILDSVSRGRAEQKRIFYLSISSARAERGVPAQASPKSEPGKAPRAA